MVNADRKEFCYRYNITSLDNYLFHIGIKTEKVVSSYECNAAFCVTGSILSTIKKSIVPKFSTNSNSDQGLCTVLCLFSR